MPNISDNKVKHLEFIQNVITRLNSNSFLIKGWTVTLVAALFALAAKEADRSFFIIAYLPTTAFWYLDSYFLSQERKYRQLYNIVRKTDMDFSMDTSICTDDRNKIEKTIISKTILYFYLIVLVVSGIITIKFN